MSDSQAPKRPPETPPAVRVTASLLFGIAVAVLSLDVGRYTQLVVLVGGIAAALLYTFSHPYRRDVRAYLEARGLEYKPRFRNFAPLMVVWIGIMITIGLPPMPWWGTAIVFVINTAWIYIMYPFIDGTRGLSSVQDYPLA